mgnify:FL=1
MLGVTVDDLRGDVALRKESVDRNIVLAGYNRGWTSRSPQGERG